MRPTETRLLRREQSRATLQAAPGGARTNGWRTEQTLRDADQLNALPIDRAVASAFATLAVEMRTAGHGKLGIHDAWIAPLLVSAHTSCHPF
jgi:predicted nucleic acid-binding protein